MSMQKPMDVEQVAQNKRAAKEKRAKYTIGIVAPNGAMNAFYCPPPDDGGDEGPKNGDVPVRWVNGEPQVTKRYKARGYILYSDLAKADGEPEKAEMWQRSIAQQILGLPLRGDVNALYSKSVLERRAQSAAGSRGSGGKAFDVEAGEVVDDPEAKKRRLASLLTEATGLAPPEELAKKAEAEADARVEARAKAAEEKAEAEAQKKLDAKIKKLEADAKKKLDAKMKVLESKATADTKAAKDGGKAAE